MQPPKFKFKFPKKNILRRRTDDLNQVIFVILPLIGTIKLTNISKVECGISKTSENTIQKRIIGGRNAYFAEYPWQAHIRIAEYQCGGVLGSKTLKY